MTYDLVVEVWKE